MVDVVCIGPYLLFFSPSPRLGFWSSYSGGDLYYAGRGLTGSVIAGYRISHAGPPNTRLITAETGGRLSWRVNAASRISRRERDKLVYVCQTSYWVSGSLYVTRRTCRLYASSNNQKRTVRSAYSNNVYCLRESKFSRNIMLLYEEWI